MLLFYPHILQLQILKSIQIEQTFRKIEKQNELLQSECLNSKERFSNLIQKLMNYKPF